MSLKRKLLQWICDAFLGRDSASPVFVNLVWEATVDVITALVERNRVADRPKFYLKWQCVQPVWPIWRNFVAFFSLPDKLWILGVALFIVDLFAYPIFPSSVRVESGTAPCQSTPEGAGPATLWMAFSNLEFVCGRALNADLIRVFTKSYYTN